MNKRFTRLMLGVRLLVMLLSLLVTGYAHSITSESMQIQHPAVLQENLRLGQYDLAIKYWRDQLRSTPSEDTQIRAQIYYEIAKIQYLSGFYNRAEQALRKATEVLPERQQTQLRLNLELALAATMAEQLSFQQSKPLLDHLLNEGEEALGPKQWAKLHYVLGRYYFQAGLLGASEQAFSKALGLARGMSDSYLSANVILALIDTLHRIGLTNINQADENREKISQQWIALLPELDAKADNYSRLNQFVAASEKLARYMGIYPDNGNSAIIVKYVHELYESLEHANALGRLELKSRVLGTLALFYARNQQYQDALNLLGRAVFHAQQIAAVEQLFYWEWLQGTIFLKLGELDKSINAYQHAVHTLEPLRHVPNIKSNIFNKPAHGIYSDLADALLVKSDSMESSAEKQRIWLQARDIFEKKKVAELQDYFNDQCMVSDESGRKSLEQNLSEQSAVIYPLLLDSRVELLVSFADEIQRYTVSKSADEVTDQVRALRLKLEKLRTREYLPYAQTLYRWLLAEVEPELERRSIDTLIFVADQSLRTIPFSALHDGKQFLIDKYAIATTPGLQLTDATPLNRSEMKVLLSGVSESVQGFPALRHVEGELEDINDLYISELLLNRDFIKDKLSGALLASDYSIAHIASHSEFNGNVQDSYILTYDDKITVGQLSGLASIGRRRGKNLDLITLSACQTAAGSDQAALGLAGVAVRSGAKSALATLWAINDKASSLLVAEFYRQLLSEKLSKAQALQQAQLKIMKNVRYRHPGYWSPFLIIGNWL